MCSTNDTCSFLVHFRIVTLNSNFVPVNDKVGILLGRGKVKGVAQTEREQRKEEILSKGVRRWDPLRCRMPVGIETQV